MTKAFVQPDPTWWADEREAAFSRSGALGRIIACTLALVVGLGLGALLHGVLGG